MQRQGLAPTFLFLFQVGGRLLKYSYQAGRVSQWIASKLQSSMTKNMVFPSCSDIPLPFLMGVDHPKVAFVPPDFLAKGEARTLSAFLSIFEGILPTWPAQSSSLAWQLRISKLSRFLLAGRVLDEQFAPDFHAWHWR